ncbi:C4-dicarboxylate transporter/malic acid transport protein, partial [Penicillium argentinense]
INMSNAGRSLEPPERPRCLALWNFASQWFLIPQGTGIISVILYRLDYQFSGLQTLAKIVWIYTIVLLGLCLALYMLRVAIYPQYVRQQLRTNLVETSCLSSIPITFTSILQLAALQYGHRAGLAIYILWWISTALAIIACLGIPYIQLKLQPPGMHHLPPAILLPFIAALTSAAGGGVICRFCNLHPRLQVPALIISYLEVGAGLALSGSFDALLLFQHFDRFHAPADKVWQDMIVCGPFGQGSFALQVLGEAAEKGSFAAYDRGTFLTAAAGKPIGFISQFLGLLTWGYGVFWWCFAILSICHTACGQPGGWRATQFSLSAWSLIFPWGVFANSAVEFGKIMASPAFAVVSTGLLLLLLVMWVVMQVLTVKGIVTGRIVGLPHGWKARRADAEPKAA